LNGLIAIFKKKETIMYLKWLQGRVMDDYLPIKGSQEHPIKVNKFAHKCKATYCQLHPIVCLIKSVTWMLQNEKVNDQGNI
jgi:hypothetical protein